ncbi:hypothetical protein ERO13_D12G093900v2 [Gossypium hirsutum]|nr:hypothetical protein ERO13_D12G093900v2 [Gossypium hirsutum]
MRKGGKRKSTSQKQETEVKASSSSQENQKENHKLASQAKRAKTSKPQPQLEYFEDKRNLVRRHLKRGGGYMGRKFISSVAQSVVSPFPPSDKIGINSVQREAEEIVPMKQMKMDWVPYIPLENRDSQVDRLQSQMFILSCTQRRVALKQMKIDRLKKYEYCLPYFYQPLKEDELEQSTEVQIIFPAAQKPVFCEFDWELDELDEFTDQLIEADELDKDKKDAFKEFVKERVREAKKANRQAREARKKALEEMSEETKAAFVNMRFYKFYPVPTPDTPDVSNVKVLWEGS